MENKKICGLVFTTLLFLFIAIFSAKSGISQCPFAVRKGQSYNSIKTFCPKTLPRPLLNTIRCPKRLRRSSCKRHKIFIPRRCKARTIIPKPTKVSRSCWGQRSRCGRRIIVIVIGGRPNPEFIKKIIAILRGKMGFPPIPGGTPIPAFPKTPRTPTPPTTPARPTFPPTNPTNPPVTGETATAIAKEFGVSLTTDGTQAPWTQSQMQMVYNVLKKLPATFRSASKEIRKAMPPHPGVLGYCSSRYPHRTNLCGERGTNAGTLVHEMTHNFQYTHPDIMNKWAKTFWGPRASMRSRGVPKSSSVSRYGNTNPAEDMAESVRVYVTYGKRMKQRYPERYEFIKKYIMNGVEF